MRPRLSRREFLDRRREICRARYDQRHPATYDQVWGQVDPTHAECVSALVAMTPPGGELLDAACGTGKYWPRLLAAGRRVYGIDQSAAMLAQAAAKHPDVPTCTAGRRTPPGVAPRP